MAMAICEASVVQHALVLFVEERRLRVLQVEHADDAAFVEQRHNQLRARLGIHGDVARILAHVGHVDQPPLAYRRAHQSAADGNAPHGRMRVAESPRIARDQRLAFFVEQHDREHLVVDQPPQQLADLLEQRIQIENRRQLHRNLVQHFEGLRLARDARIQSRVLNRLRDARSRHGEHVQVLVAEEIRLLAFDVHHADEPVLGDQRDGQLRTHLGIGADVVIRLRDVVQQDGLPRERHLSHHSLAHGNAHALHLRRVADLEPHAQLVRALIQQKNGEDAVRNEGADQFRGAAEQSLQIEGSIERVGQAHQIRHIRRLDAGIDGIQMRGLGRAVIALEFVPCGRGWRRFAHKGSKGMIQQGPGAGVSECAVRTDLVQPQLTLALTTGN